MIEKAYADRIQEILARGKERGFHSKSALGGLVRELTLELEGCYIRLVLADTVAKEASDKAKIDAFLAGQYLRLAPPTK